MITQPLKWHGGKKYLAKKIVAIMPRHIHYVEPYAGGAAVLLARDPNDEKLWLTPHKGVSEVLNDINKELMNFWMVLSNPKDFEKFFRQVKTIPLGRESFTTAMYISDDVTQMNYITKAVAFFVLARQSLAGRFKGFTALTRNRLRRGINGNASEWLGAVDGLPEVHARLRPVVLENMDAIELIKREDAPGTLFYCDPPYLHETRSSTDVYEHEMTEDQHRELLVELNLCVGKVMLSGYASTLYDLELSHWNIKTFDLPNNSAGGSKKERKTEVLWMNY